MPRHLVFDPRYNTNLSEFGMEKPFALDRGELVLAEIARRFGQQSAQYDRPEPISDEDILLVHSREYLDSLQKPETWLEIMEFRPEEFLPERATRKLPELLDDIRLKCGGTVLAAKNALKLGLCANLGAGYHHAFPHQGRGYCVLHDVAIAVRRLKSESSGQKVLVIDLDYHQGDGTALIFKDDPNTFTLSVHSQPAWPESKQQSDIDVPIYENEEHLYLEKTEEALRRALKRFSPDLVLYVGGSDPYEKDVLPGTMFIRMSLEQLIERERFVVNTFADLGIPFASVFAGGYGPHVWQVHYWTIHFLLERSGIILGTESTK